MNKEFVKHDHGKLRWSLLPWFATETVVNVLTFGALKYTPNNWRNSKDTSRFVDACMRHMQSYLSGETHDPESGIHHLSHAICNLMFIIELEAENTKK